MVGIENMMQDFVFKSKDLITVGPVFIAVIQLLRVCEFQYSPQ